MNIRSLRDRIADAQHAAALLSDCDTMLSLAAEALATAVPGGFALAFTRRATGTFGSVAAWSGRRRFPRERIGAPATPIRWIVDLECVPAWQQNRWIEPIGAGVHGKDYFLRDNPLSMLLTGSPEAPDYGRAMLCRDGRMIAWMGLYVEGRRGFADEERRLLAEVTARLAPPLRLAALVENGGQPIRLSKRQSEIMVRVARGWTNKRIARDLEVSPATVKTFLERLFRLSGADNRTALVQWWRDGDPGR